MRYWSAGIIMGLIFSVSCNGGQEPELPKPPDAQNIVTPPPKTDSYEPFADPQKRLEAYQAVQMAMRRNKGQHLGLNALLKSDQENIHPEVHGFLKEMATNLESIQGVRPWETADRNKEFIGYAAESLQTTRDVIKESWDRANADALYDRLIKSCNQCHDAFTK